MIIELSCKNINISLDHLKGLSIEVKMQKYKAIENEMYRRSEILENNGFKSTGWNEFKFKSEDFYKILKILKREFPLLFNIRIKLTKKEADKQKAFLLWPRSVIALKNDLSYNGKDYPIEPKCFTSDYKVCYYEEGAAMGNVAWKDNYFKTSEYNHIQLACSPTIKELIEKEKLSGFQFGAIHNITKKTQEPFWCISPQKQLSQYAIKDKLTKEVYREEHDCKYVLFDGAMLYAQGAFDNIDDLNLTKEAAGCLNGELIVSQRFRQFYLNRNLKGLGFKPVFEIGSEFFEEYNELIKELAKELLAYNDSHVIGLFSEVPANQLANGLL